VCTLKPVISREKKNDRKRYHLELNTTSTMKYVRVILVDFRGLCSRAKHGAGLEEVAITVEGTADRKVDGDVNEDLAHRFGSRLSPLHPL
jgi:hypothetical protein